MISDAWGEEWYVKVHADTLSFINAEVCTVVQMATVYIVKYSWLHVCLNFVHKLATRFHTIFICGCSAFQFCQLNGKVHIHLPASNTKYTLY